MRCRVLCKLTMKGLSNDDILADCSTAMTPSSAPAASLFERQPPARFPIN